ncbi:hypothetical protein RJ641_030390 [Dillenia turbinata]|uniref:EID1-like F-box protein 3 n=1 Tax=Dillenia turbinata TaxID=194707 RepID=A0AAN8ZH23_9MAGN
MSESKRVHVDPATNGSVPNELGIFNEQVLVLLFESIKWDLTTLCKTASVCRKLRAVAMRLLWRRMCVYRAPRMVHVLTNGGPSSRVGCGWLALAKLLFFCCGWHPTRNFQVGRTIPGHFVKESRFSKTAGRSFLTRKCRSDLLYVSDPCEHAMTDQEADLGVYRGVFRGFSKSRTRACLIGRGVELEERVKCPYCGARVWSMTTAGLVPKSASRRLGSLDGTAEYFVCVNGHLHGACWLVPLTDEDENSHDISNDEEDDEDDDNDEGTFGANGSVSSTGEEFVVDDGWGN